MIQSILSHIEHSMRCAIALRELTQLQEEHNLIQEELESIVKSDYYYSKLFK